MSQWCWWEGGWVDVDRFLRRSTQGCDRCTSDCHPLHCSPTLPSLHPAVNLLTTSCSCKTDNNNDRILQMDRRLKKVSTTLHKRCPDALSHTCRRRKVSELECAELVIFPVAFLQWQKQPSYIGRLLSGGLTPTTSISFERN